MSDDPTTARRRLPSGAELAVRGDVVVKLHHRRTDVAVLARRLQEVTCGASAHLWLQPVEPDVQDGELVVRAPNGRAVTGWPRVEVLDPADTNQPWAACGSLLAALHSTPLRPGTDDLPPHGGPARLARAIGRVEALAHPSAPMLTRLGHRLLDEARSASGPRTLAHGDWHLGQVARTPQGLRLIDVDDLGLGDPAWDLARPAGFWAVGALDDRDWDAFLAAYRAGGGPAVPAHGDPWPTLDLAARCAVFVAAVRELLVQPAHSRNPADPLLEACARM